MNSIGELKALFLPAWYPSEEQPVAGVFVKEHAKAVSLYNNVVVLFITPANDSMPGLYSLTDEIEEGIRTIRVKYRKSPLPYTNFLLSYCVTLMVYRKLVTDGFRPDVIHAHVFSAGVPAVMLGRLYRIPILITEHFSGFPRNLLSLFDLQMARFAMSRAQYVLPVSENLKRHIEARGIHAKFNVIPNVFCDEIFYPTNSKRINENINKKKKLLTVSLLDPIKGVPNLLKAVNGLHLERDDFKLDIVGDGPTRSEYEKLAHELGLDGIVHFHGLKTKTEVAEFMRRCDVFVLPSIWENLPCVLIEVMACGKPIVASHVGGIPEMINENIGCLVPLGNVDELTKTLDYMLDHYMDYDSQAIAKYAREKYSYEAVGSQIDKLYRQAIVDYKAGKKHS